MNQKNWTKPIVGISSCLLGNRVRYNGDHKKNEWLTDCLGPFVSWIPICPEVEMGLGVPRIPLRLTGDGRSPKLITANLEKNLTEQAYNTFENILKREHPFDGYIFKKNSPTCGLERVKIYDESGSPSRYGVGLFAQEIKNKYSNIPIIEDGRLNDKMQREAFLIQLFCWAEFRRLPYRIAALQFYQQNHKLQFMAYDPQGYQDLGQIAANSDRQAIHQVFEKYEFKLCELFKNPITASKNINVFEHMIGYFKKCLDIKDRVQLFSLLEDYRDGKIPLVTLSFLFKFLSEKYCISYLQTQSMLEPFPSELNKTS